MTVERTKDETPLGGVASPVLQSLYLAAVDGAARTISPGCMEGLRQRAGSFLLWPNALQAGLMVQPSRLPHALAACNVPALIGMDVLRRQGAQRALLDIIEAPRTAPHQALGAPKRTP